MPSADVYWKKERNIKNSNRCDSARARFLWERRNPVNSQGAVTLATSEPSWNQRGTKQEPCEFIGFRHTCDVGTIVEPSWNQAGTL